VSVQASTISSSQSVSVSGIEYGADGGVKSEVYFASHFTTLNSSIYQFISFQDVESAQIVKSVHTQVNGHDHDIIQS